MVGKWGRVMGLVWGLCGSVWALSATVQLIPDSIKLGESALLRLTVSGKGVESLSGVSPPNLSGVDMGSATEETLFTPKGRQLTTSRFWQFTVRPFRSGLMTIPPFVIVHQGKTIQTRPIQLWVAEPVNPKLGRIQGTISLTSYVSSKQVVVGEPIQYDLVAKTDRPLEDGYVLTPPKLDGFITLGVPTPSMVANRSVSGGTLRLSSRVIAATQPGIVTIPNATIVIQFQGQAINHVAVSDPIDIEVRPLPTPPSDFTGGIGEFELRWENPPRTARLNTPLGLTMVLTGWGNTTGFRGVTIPTSTHYHVTDYSMMPHSKDWTQLTISTQLLPRQPGPMVVEGVSMTAFSPSRQRFYTISLPKLVINVAATHGPILPYSPRFRGPIQGVSHHWMPVVLALVGLSLTLIVGSEVGLWVRRRHRRQSQFKQYRTPILAQLAVLSTRPLTRTDAQRLQQQVMQAIQSKVSGPILSLLPAQLIGVLVDQSHDNDWIDLILEWGDCVDTIAFSGESVSPELTQSLIQLTRQIIKKLDQWGDIN